MSTNRDIRAAHQAEQNEALLEAMRTTELAMLADAFCRAMAANNFDLDHLPFPMLEKLRNAASSMASTASRTIAERYRELLEEHTGTAAD